MPQFKDTLLLVDKVSRPLQKIQENIKKTTDRTDKLQNSFAKMGGKLAPVGAKMQAMTKTLVKSFVALGAAAGVAGAAGVKSLMAYGDRVDKMSQKIGMSQKAFQEWDYIMSQNGGNVETLQMGFKTLTTQIEGVQKGSKDSIRAFAALGVAVKDSNGQFRSQDDIFNETISKLQKIQNPTKKAMLANRLFGRSATELRPLLNQEAETIDNLRKKANKMGFILSEEDVKNAVKFTDTMDTFGRFFQAQMYKGLAPLLPILDKLFVSIPDYFSQLKKKVTPAMQALRAEFDKFATENPEFINALKVSFDWLLNTGLPKLIEGLTLVAGSTIRTFSAISYFFNSLGGAIGNIVGLIITIPDKIYIAFQKVITKLLDILMPLIKFFQNIRQEFIKTETDGANIAGSISQKIGKSKGNGGNVDNSQHNSNNSSVINNNIKQYFAGWVHPKTARLTPA